MLDYDTAIELMKKYGYSSTTTHPYIYQSGSTLGICYSYEDEDFGQLERIKIFEDKESFELFLKQLEWVKNNGRNFHVRMILDNYESINPKTLFLRNEKLLMDGEMFDLESYDYREMQRDQMDDVSKIIYEAGDLLLVYDEIKGRQLQYLNSIVKLKNTLREKYFELQKEVDSYNKYKVERHLTLLSEVTDIGINDSLEITVKDKYNLYVVQLPSYEEAADFLREVWELNKNLELNVKYYEAQKDETNARNELKVVEKKLELMKKLNEDLRPFFGTDLMSKFRKINKQCALESNSISDNIIQDNINRTARKYEVFDSLDLLYTSDYLREAIQNTNYADLAIKYSKNSNKELLNSFRIPPNEVAASLSIQYRDKLDVSEQAIIVLYNNHKYRKLCNAILSIQDFESLPIKKIISKISGIKGYSKIKSECYDIVKRRLEDPVNINIKNSLFSGYDFSTYETFIASLVRELIKLRNINNKMILNGDINMYLVINKPEDINNKKFVMVTNDINSLLIETKESKDMIGITLLKKHTPVLYSPYYLDFGDIYSKDASLQMSIKEMVNFELLVEISDIIINIDPVKTEVVRYYSQPITVENVSVVDDIKASYKTAFCKFAFTNGLNEVIPELPATVVSPVFETPVSNVVSSESTSDELTIFNNSAVINPVVDNNIVVNSQVPESQEGVLAEQSIIQGDLESNSSQNNVDLSLPLSSTVSSKIEVNSEVVDSKEQNEKVDVKLSKDESKGEDDNKSVFVLNAKEENNELKNDKSEDKVDDLNNGVQEASNSKKEIIEKVSLEDGGTSKIVNDEEKTKQEAPIEVSKDVVPENEEKKDKELDNNKKEDKESDHIVNSLPKVMPESQPKTMVMPSKKIVNTSVLNQGLKKVSGVPGRNVVVKPNVSGVQKQPIASNQNSSLSKKPVSVNQNINGNGIISNKVTKPMPQPVKKEVKVVGTIGKPVRQVSVNKQPGIPVKREEK